MQFGSKRLKSMSNEESLKIVETLAYLSGYVIGPGGTLYDRRTGTPVDVRTDREKLRDAIEAGDIEALRLLLGIDGGATNQQQHEVKGPRP